MIIGESIKVLSANCQGLRDMKKRVDVLNYFKERKVDILCLQDTHWVDKDEPLIRSIWGNNCIIHGFKTNARGLAILFGGKVEYKINNIDKSVTNMLTVDIKISDIELKLVNIYGPNTDSPAFFQHLGSVIESCNLDYILLCGDFNLILDPVKDCKHYININNPKARDEVLKLINDNKLVDIYRYIHPNTRRYTWRRRNPLRQARLDFFLSSNTFIDIISNCDIKPGYRSDHSIVSLDILINRFSRGKGIWKLNISLLKDHDYIDIINSAIADEKIKYCALVYNHDFILDPYSKLELRIDYDTFLEVLLLRLRGETIKYSSHLKKQRLLAERNLESEIEHLESISDQLPILNLLNEKNEQLEELRSDRMKGHIIRSRAEWLTHGEKPSRYFCSLENRLFLEKTIKRVKKPDGSYILDQKEILAELQTFYASLYKNHDLELENVDLNNLLSDSNVKKLNTIEANGLEGKLSENEILIVLRNMQNNKTPGIDGFPSEFFKVFWLRLKFYLLKSINTCYDKGILSQSLRQCVISCLPKGDKSRDLLKNWRPISLLSVVYKLASGAIANRIKSVLDKIISSTQTGYISGRYIGDSIRYIYDIMHYAENEKVDGLLMLIDFQKAFDSLSWNFLYKSLEFFGFQSSLIKWIHIFNNNIQASVIQCGNLSNRFSIGRGARQGDPISAYLFILCGEILSILIKLNKNVRGIIIDDNEHKLTQFADDTTLILDGSIESLQAALNVLEIFGSISGLKMNSEKTKLIWIGRKKHCKDKLQTSIKFEWGNTDFDLLGLVFSVDLQHMIEINFQKAISKINIILKNWKRRHLTPIGKITVIKTFIISKLNYLFSSLPTPKQSTIKKIIDIIYNFLWDNKPDKINRIQLSQDYLQGGLKMINIQHFIKATKSTWVRRLLNGNGAPWISILDPNLLITNNLSVFGPQWCKTLIRNVKNSFWKDVFESWQEVSEATVLKYNSDYINSCLWYNGNISKFPLFYPSWFKKGIVFIKDILNNDGSLLSTEQILDIYKLNNINFLEYHRIKLLVNKFLSLSKSEITNHQQGPIMPHHIKVLYMNKKGIRDMYNNLNRIPFQSKMKIKWKDDLDSEIDNLTWRCIFKACFKVVIDNSIIWFQYRLLHRILGVKKYLHQINISNTDTCRLCSNETESIIHLFVHCPRSKDLWCSLKHWIYQMLHLEINLTTETILLGYLYSDSNFEPINFVILNTKYYIFLCALYDKPLILDLLKTKLRKSFLEQQLAAKISFQEENFSKIWNRWIRIF